MTHHTQMRKSNLIIIKLFYGRKNRYVSSDITVLYRYYCITIHYHYYIMGNSLMSCGHSVCSECLAL